MMICVFTRRISWVVAALAATLAGCGGSSTFDGDCEQLGGPAALVAIAADDGRLLWKRTIGDIDVTRVGSIVVGIGRSGAAIGVDAGTGEIRWCADFGDIAADPHSVIPGFATIGDVAATTVSGAVVAIDVHTGRELWRTPIDPVEGARVVADDGRFAVGGASVVVATTADPSTGSLPPPTVTMGPLLDPATGATTNDAGKAEGRDSITLDVDQPYLAGRQLMEVRVSLNGTVQWEHQLPGFAAELHEDAVIVIDQTGGSGVVAEAHAGVTVDTRVTAYDLVTGEQRWQLALPGTPHRSIQAGRLVIVPVGTEMFAIDRASGAIAWRVDHGSPGRGGRYSEPGDYQTATVDPDDPSKVVGVVVAGQPYRD
jgi:outer membrane protein assembly factor BamB